MNPWYYLIAFGLIIVMLDLFKKKKEGTHTDEPDIDETASVDLTYFSAKQGFFNTSERVFFDMLRQELGNAYVVLSKTRLEDVISVQKKDKADSKDVQHLKYGSRKRINSRHVDFVILDPHTSAILLAIELDGKSHSSSQAHKSDAFKDDLFRHVGIPLHRVKVGSDFNEEITAIQNVLR